MSADLAADTQAVLLLTAPLIVGRGVAGGRPEPLSDGEYDRLARGLREHGRAPADLLGADAGAALEECASGLERDRLERLLGRGSLLGQAVERWRARGLWVVGRADADYPRRLKERLGRRAPPLLYGFGDRAALGEGGLAVVGSRDADDERLAHAGRAGCLAADARRALISGGARGIDRAAMRGALEAGGRAVGALANDLERAVMRRGDREVLMDGRLVLLSPCDPAEGFHVWHAMRRNRLIYALADAALVVSADHGKGGTWAGALEQLEKYRRVPVYVHAAGESERGWRGCGNAAPDSGRTPLRRKPSRTFWTRRRRRRAPCSPTPRRRGKRRPVIRGEAAKDAACGGGRLGPRCGGRSEGSGMATPEDDGLLRRERSALVAVDLQERLMPAIADGEAVVKAAGMLIDAARTLAVPVVATEQYPKGLGPTVPAIAGRLPDDAPVVAKLTFGAVRNRDFTAHIDALAAEGRDHLVLCGVESHVCVLQTAAALHARGGAVHLAVDACGSRRAASKDAALARCRAMGISCVTVEMVLFEWLEAAGTDEFKAVSALVK